QPDPQAQPRLAVGLAAPRGRGSAPHVSPPETEIAWPVTPALPHSHSTTSATSSGLMKRPCGLLAASVARTSAALRFVVAAIRSTDAASIPVSVKPGHTALTVMPVDAVSSASARIRPTTPCLAATYGATYG